jgi:hypothetical protein
MFFERSVTVPIEIAHHSISGALHGHTLMVEVWTRANVDLDAWKEKVSAAVAFMENGPLEQTVGRTFEEVAVFIFTKVPGVSRVAVRLPSRGHSVEVSP